MVDSLPQNLKAIKIRSHKVSKNKNRCDKMTASKTPLYTLI